MPEDSRLIDYVMEKDPFYRGLTPEEQERVHKHNSDQPDAALMDVHSSPAYEKKEARLSVPKNRLGVEDDGGIMATLNSLRQLREAAGGEPFCQNGLIFPVDPYKRSRRIFLQSYPFTKKKEGFLKKLKKWIQKRLSTDNRWKNGKVKIQTCKFWACDDQLTWSVTGRLPYRIKTTLIGFWHGYLYFILGQRDRGLDNPLPKKVI